MRFPRPRAPGASRRADRRLHRRQEPAPRRGASQEAGRDPVESEHPMPAQVRNASARQFFSRHGTLSKWHPNYEFRPGQVEMAEAVESAITDKRHLIVEAGTGTGKTLAYLVP